MRFIFPKPLVFFLLFCTVFLTHCTRFMPGGDSENKKIASPYTMPSDAYLALANNQTGQERKALQIMAAGRAIYDGQWRNGLAIIRSIGPLNGILTDQKNILLAKVDIMRNQSNDAIAKLADVRHLQQLDLFYQAQYHDMLAYAYQKKGLAVEAVSERIKLDTLLPNRTAKKNNQRSLWLSLTQLSQPELNTLLAENADNNALKGWASLAVISRTSYVDPQVMIDDLHHWRAAFPTHSANQLLPENLDSLTTQLLPAPRHMALMLPLTGPLAGPGHAIQDGFMEAYRSGGQMRRVGVRIYNTDHADVAQVYQHALEEGADYIVGPLSKADVAEIAPLKHTVPTILLNDTDRRLDGLAFQFGLSPIHEARQIAVKARKAGHTRALMIAPDGAWGNDIIQAFSQQWALLGGRVIDTWQYAPQENLSMGVRELLHASEYNAKAKSIHAIRSIDEDNLGKRRQDFDVIVLVAYPSKARQIMPLLRYYFAGDIPIYATSAVYSGTENTAKDRDLDGIIFCDMPWIFNHPVMADQHHWAEQLNSYTRLYALGMDSYLLAGQLNHLLLFPALGIHEKSGIIYLTKSHELSRILVFGQFKNGVATPLEPLDNSNS